MFAYIWPITLVILANVVYQICAKSSPAAMNPLASLTITYLVGAGFSALLYFILAKEPNLIREYGKLNWAPFVLGFVIVGLEVGSIYAYRAGWEISVEFIVQSAFVSVLLIFVGMMIYKETVSWNKIVGVIICLVGLVFMNLKKG